MGKHGLIGEKPRSMHDICSSRNIQKKKQFRDTIKMKSYEQIVSKAKPQKIQETIRELQNKERAGKLEHNEYIKLMANKKMLKKKQDSGPNKEFTKFQQKAPEEYTFSAEEIRSGKFYQDTKNTDPMLAEPGFGKKNEIDPFLSGFEPNSSYKPTGPMPMNAKSNFISEQTISKNAILYQNPEIIHKPENIFKPKPISQQKGEEDPLTSEQFENEIIHRKKIEEKKDEDLSKNLNKPAESQKISKEEEKKKLPVPIKRPMFIPSSVRALKRKKEESEIFSEPQISKNIPEQPEIQAPPKQTESVKLKTVSNVPAPEGLMLFDLSDEDENSQKNNNLKDFINDLQ